MKVFSKVLVIILFTFFTMFLLTIDYTNIGLTQNYNNIFLEINQFLKSFDIIHFLIGIFIFYFYYQVYYDDSDFTKKNIILVIISTICSTIILIGKNLQLRNSFPNIFEPILLIKSLIIFLGSYFAFYAILKKVFQANFFKIFKKKRKKKSNKTFLKFRQIGKNILSFIDKHPIITTIIFILLCRLPYIVIYFPFSATGDTYDSLCQFFNLDTSWSKDMVNLINPNIYLNSHHPVFFTLLFGSVLKLGAAIHSFALGAFLYTIIQTIFSTIIFTFIIYYMKKINIPLWIRITTLLFFGLIPIISSYTILAVKDTPSALFTLLYIVFLIQIVRNYNSIFNSKIIIIYFIINMLLVMLFRNNGIITLIFSYPFLFILYKKYWKKLLIVFLIPITIYFSFNQIMYKVFDVSKGSPKEMLSIPFMQIARVVSVKGTKAFSKKDKLIIDKIIGFDDLGSRYMPNISDYVKDKYNKNTTKKDLKNFFKVWFKYLWKYPNIYIESFINSTYQYFYPNEDMEDFNLGLDSRVALKFHINNIEKYQNTRINFLYIIKILSKTPIIGIFFHVACYTWFLLISCAYIIYKKNYKYLIPLSPLLSVLLVCLASPLNGSIRYTLPIIFSLPTCIIVTYITYKESKIKNIPKT